MNPDNSSWILVDGSNPISIQHAITEHSQIAIPVAPCRHRASIIQIDVNRYGVIFDPSVPPYEFVNLIAWLNDPKFTSGVIRASGWLIAPASGIRYSLVPERANPDGDTLVGVGSDGSSVSVYLPDCSVSQSAARVTSIPEPDLSGRSFPPIASFETTVDGDTSFGNPLFRIQ